MSIWSVLPASAEKKVMVAAKAAKKKAVSEKRDMVKPLENIRFATPPRQTMTIII
jgi:hypothetical protein